MTVVNPKSISGITSITTASGSDNLLTIHTSDANNTERFRIDSTGSAKVGSGITLSPDGDIFTTGISTFGGKTTINGNLLLNQQDPKIFFNDGGAMISNAEVANTLAFFSDGSNETLRITSAGLVGINSSNPSELIDVLKTSNDAKIKTTTTGAGAYFEADSAATQGYYGLILSSSGTDRWFVGSYNSDNFQIKNGSGVSGTEVITIQDTNNYFGLNHTTPSGVLHISSGTSGDCELIIEADTDNNNENDNPRILFRQDGGSDWNAIGTNDNVLEISNSVSLGGGISFKTGYTNGYTNATERVRIESAGNVKIEKNLNVVGVCTANTVEDSIGELRAFPVTAYGSNVVVAGHHAGKTLTNTTGGWTFNTDTNFAVGEVMRVVNKSGSGQIVYKGGGITLYSSRDSGTNGDHTIKARGSAIIICTATDEYYVSGDI